MVRLESVSLALQAYLKKDRCVPPSISIVIRDSPLIHIRLWCPPLLPTHFLRELGRRSCRYSLVFDSGNVIGRDFALQSFGFELLGDR